MEEWEWLGVPSPLIRGLSDLGFRVPTPVQKEAIAVTLKTSGDVIGAAETVGSYWFFLPLPPSHFSLVPSLHPLSSLFVLLVLPLGFSLVL